MSFVVHSVPGSPFGRAVLATLEEKGVPYRLQALQPAERHSPTYLALHPFGRIPAFEHDGFRLYETQAILRYLDRVLPEPALTPSDVKRAARMDQVMNVNDWYLFQGVGSVIIFHRVVAPRLMGQAPDEEAIKAAMPKAHTVFNELARLLGEQPYFTGDTLSLADLIVAPHVEYFTITPEWNVLGAQHANLGAWVKRMQERPSMKATTWERVAELAKAA
ncbi:MAG TPA: glutathione S-transferase family protein [Bradyrhizobium sp.]|uniref:glutathione S-transferase family protein n=1 Tax=Bradyrhizobium sp. TaxID=376 RepID=UPI002B7520FE|nr:glutathione S-transferase family protein [Bradyrhizobium sp.]HLZ05635.1 glutathione S-transferase family protein [Bradyrhizobium sp.]